MIRPPQKAAENVSTTTPTDSSDASQKVNTLITSVNKPNVRMVIGNVNKTKSGLTIEFTADRTIEKKTTSRKLSIVKPGIVCQIVITTNKVMTNLKISSIR